MGGILKGEAFGDVSFDGGHPQAFDKLRRDAALEAATRRRVLPFDKNVFKR